MLRHILDSSPCDELPSIDQCIIEGMRIGQERMRTGDWDFYVTLTSFYVNKRYLSDKQELILREIIYKYK